VVCTAPLNRSSCYGDRWNCHYIIIIIFIINYFRFRKTNIRHLGILLSVSIATILLYWGCHSATGCRISSKSVELWCYIDFQDGGRSGAILLPVSDCLTTMSSEDQCLSATKCRSFSSIHVWVISISYLEKQTSAIPYWNFSSGCYFDHIICNRRAIPHRATKFRPNEATRGGVMASYTISRRRQRWPNTTSGFVFDDVTLSRSKSPAN